MQIEPWGSWPSHFSEPSEPETRSFRHRPAALPFKSTARRPARRRHAFRCWSPAPWPPNPCAVSILSSARLVKTSESKKSYRKRRTFGRYLAGFRLRLPRKHNLNPSCFSVPPPLATTHRLSGMPFGSAPKQGLVLVHVGAYLLPRWCGTLAGSWVVCGEEREICAGYPKRIPTGNDPQTQIITDNSRQIQV